MIKNRNGFSLVEIMVVVAIIALLSAIAIPNLLGARRNANEANAQALLRTIATACESYASAQNGEYPAAMADLTGGASPYLTSDYMGDSQGYNFAWPTEGDTSTFRFTAEPLSASTGTRSFSICDGAILNEAPGSTAPGCS